MPICSKPNAPGLTDGQGAKLAPLKLKAFEHMTIKRRWLICQLVCYSKAGQDYSIVMSVCLFGCYSVLLTYIPVVFKVIYYQPSTYALVPKVRRPMPSPNSSHSTWLSILSIYRPCSPLIIPALVSLLANIHVCV